VIARTNEFPLFFIPNGTRLNSNKPTSQTNAVTSPVSDNQPRVLTFWVFDMQTNVLILKSSVRGMVCVTTSVYPGTSKKHSGYLLLVRQFASNLLYNQQRLCSDSVLHAGIHSKCQVTNMIRTRKSVYITIVDSKSNPITTLLALQNTDEWTRPWTLGWAYDIVT